MKNLNEFINYINRNLTGDLKNDLSEFYKNILPKDRQLTIDESIEVINKCPKLLTILLSINPDNKLVNSSTIYSAFRTMTEDIELADDFDEDKIVSERDKIYFSDIDIKSLKLGKGDLDLLKLHLSEIGPIPILSKKEIIELFKRYEKGDEEARNQIIIHNLKLSANIAKRYAGRGVAIMDLIDQGYLGLMRAVEKYNYRLGYNFSTYATWWIRQAMSRYIADHSLTVRIPVHAHEAINKIRVYVDAYVLANNCEPTKEEILNATLVSEKSYELYQYISTNSFMLYLDKPVSSDGTDDGDVVLGDFIPSNESENFDEQVIHDITMKEFDEALENSGLTPRELRVIKLRYGFVDGKIHTLEDVGHEYGVTRERIRQIEVKALKKLRTGKNKSKMQQFRYDYGTKEEKNPWVPTLRR